MLKSNMSIHMQTAKIILGNKDSVGQLSSSYFFYILANYVSTCCACPKTLEMAKYKGDGPTDLVEEIARHFYN